MDNALKKPLQRSIRDFVSARANDFTQSIPRSIPCRVTKVDKDFVTVSFEPKNKVYTLPTVKIPQSFSPYAREPTQVGDLGYAVPSNYYLGGITGDSGGSTNFYPRGNLTTLSFQPISQKKTPSRDYDQYTITGGPKGVKIIQSGQQSSSSLSSDKPLQNRLVRMSTQAQRHWLKTNRSLRTVEPLADTSKTYIDIDDRGDMHHVPGDTTQKIYLGGDGHHGTYDFVATMSGPCINVLGRIG